MYLDRDDELILAGEFGETRQRLMELLVGLGTVYGAERLIPIASAQISGASYKTIGDWGLQWLSSLDARAVVPAVLNPVGMDLERWQEMGISAEFARKQEDVVRVYRRLGIRLECTCTPYYLALTNYGDHLAWSESSAVCYANSVIGARTNREGGPSALAAALVGRTPYYGLHLVRNRRPNVAVRVEDAPEAPGDGWFGALGVLVGREVGAKIPFFSGIRPTRDNLKSLGAAMAATGAVALFHVDRITPETRVFPFETGDLETITVTAAEVEAVWSDLPVEAVALGCPHCSGEELARIAFLLDGRRTTKPLYVFAARRVIQEHADVVAAIERSGARVFADTCMVVSPALERYGAIMTNSGKGFAYLPGMCGAEARLAPVEDCIAEATS
ncbi:MAG TPA: aconitase X catalytic domain-containing protein [Methanoregulaceae archaeon]|nr:aconitase X catalytic domain-containing protein [Methanoregulaceae archaeon]HQJ88262.1 aconitase X catalytic domain-containing protein [Methanoregulaceae archaeon]